MAASTFTVLRHTHKEAVVKIIGDATNSDYTIDLSVDLLSPRSSARVRAGTIAVTQSNPAVVGTGTAFTDEWIGALIYDDEDALIGTVSAVTDVSNLTLTAGDGDGLVTHDGTYSVAFHSQELDGATQAVDIIAATWTGALAGIVTLTRTARIMTLNAGASGMLQFDGQQMPSESTNNTVDIATVITGGDIELWLKLRKVSGWKTRVEPEQFGPYDDVSLAGS